MTWAIGHEDHDVREHDGRLWCVTCNADATPPEPSVVVDATAKIEDGAVGAELGIKVQF